MGPLASLLLLVLCAGIWERYWLIGLPGIAENY